MLGSIVLPPARLGVLGGGQLGRMFIVAARTMGYGTAVLDPDPESPAGQVAHDHLCAAYEDVTALDALAETCAAVTVEFENVPTAALGRLQEHILVSPSPTALEIAQDRVREKSFIQKAGIATAAFTAIEKADNATAGFEYLFAICQPPYLLKTTRWGYDGKHQREVSALADVAAAVADFGGHECILEEKIALQREVSVIVVRGYDGVTCCYPVAENEHHGGILHLSSVPARVDAAMSERVRIAATVIAEALDYHGVLGVEFFIAADGRLLVNEIAPRAHNSGHYTLDACAISQFEQQVRVMCGLPVGDIRLLSPVVMVNLLGDLWRDGEPRWETLLRRANLKLHLYGKTQAKPGRKMGHFCIVGDDIERLREEAVAAHAALQ